MRTSVTERYRTDATFRALVDMMRAAINNAEFTPSEIREAAMLAQIFYEETNLRPCFIEAVHGATIKPRGADGWQE